MKRNATAVWEGTGKEGKGHLTTQSKVLDQSNYSYLTRFENGIGTNPEELVAAAHAGCFCMKLSFLLAGDNHPAKKLEARCEVTLETSGITSSVITLHAEVPGIGAEKFAELVKDAELNCPISKVLDTEITVNYTLN